MITSHTKSALRQTGHSYPAKDKMRYGEMPILQGAVSSPENSYDTQEELRHVLEDWLLFSIHKDQHIFPVHDPMDAASDYYFQTTK